MKKIIALIIGISLVGLLAVNYLNQPGDSEELVIENTETKHDEVLTIEEESRPIPNDNLKDHLLSGGPPPDGIPPIETPKYIEINRVDYLDDLDPVFVLETLNEIYIYPQKILVWHEIVNERIDDQALSVTYCPLTGSAICYLPHQDHPLDTFGTSGKLLNSNLVMYDRATESMIPQILGHSIDGPLSNTSLATRPLLWSTWGQVKSHYESGLVLTSDTGFFRDYESDPYGSYMPDDEKSYYYFGGPLFPVLHQNDTFSAKKNVIGVKANDQVVAIDPERVKENDYLEFELGDTKAIAVYDRNLFTVRVYSRMIGDSLKSLRPDNGGLIDQDGNFYPYMSPDLKPLTHFDVMWFAWYAYYPETEVIQ